MSDIVERLHARGILIGKGLGSPVDAERAMHLAADEIERLRAELATARRDERERCAAACVAVVGELLAAKAGDHGLKEAHGASVCLARIRAMGDEGGENG